MVKQKNDNPKEKKIKDGFYIFFQNLKIIFEMYVLSYNENYKLLNEEDNIRNNILKELDPLKKKKRKDKITLEKIKFYEKEIHKFDTIDFENFKKLDLIGKQTIISIMTNFEHFRKNLVTIGFEHYTEARDHYINIFNNCAASHHAKYKDVRFIKVRENDAINPENLKLIEDHRKFTTLEKLMYNVNNDEKTTSVYNKSYKIFVIYREIRNMLIHRGNETDEKLFKSIKDGIGIKNLQPIEDFYKTFETILLFKFNETGKSLRLNPFKLVVLMAEVLNLAYVYSINLTKNKNILHSELVTVYNDMLIDYLENNDKESYFLFFHLVSFLSFSNLNIKEIKSPEFCVNTILVYDMIAKHHGEARFNKNIDKIIKVYLKHLKSIDKKNNFIHYNIIDAFLDNSRDRLINIVKHTDIYLKKSKREKTTLKEWYIFKLLKNEYFIQNYLKQ